MVFEDQRSYLTRPKLPNSENQVEEVLNAGISDSLKSMFFNMLSSVT